MTLQLNQKQKKAASHIDGPMLVLAGPGTGKTQIIAVRIAEILEKTQLDPHNILCLTFTESGVVAMRKRLIQIIGNAAYYVRIHTFHSFCNDVIRSFPEKFIFTRELEALTDVERVQIFKHLIDSLKADSPLKPFGAPYLYQRDLMFAIQNLKRENVSPEQLTKVLDETADFIKSHSKEIEDFISIHGNKLKNEDVQAIKTQLEGTPLGSFFPENLDLEKKARTQLKNDLKKEFLSIQNQLPKQRELAKVYEAYQKQIRKRGRYDYEDMILFVVQKFQEDPELLARYQEQFQYILVDEYQDTNGAQNLVVQLIGEFFESPNIFVVGDDKQSIYRFQGASLENILYFYNLYKDGIKVVSLEDNYRSSQLILDAAHALIQHNEQNLSAYIPELNQSLTAQRGFPDEKIQVAEFSSTQNENYFLAKKVQELTQSGVEPSEIAIFYRDNRDAQSIVDLFLRLGVPFRLEAGQNILHDNEIAKLIKLLHYIADLDDGNTLFYVLHFDFLGFLPLDLAKLSRLAAKARKTLFETITNEELMLSADLSSPRTFLDFAEQCAVWQSLSVNKPFAEFFDHVIKESGYLDSIMHRPDKVEHLNRLNTFFDEIKKMNRADHSLTLASFLEHLKLLEENDLPIKEHELKTQENAVRLMTAHKSKGLEFEHAFITQCVDKHWGNKTSVEKIHLPQSLLKTAASLDKKEQNEDERRLFYVALTRAKKQAYLTYSNKNENGRDQVPSIFLAEIPEQYLDRISTENIEQEALDRLQTVFLSVPKEHNSSHEEDFVRGLLQNYVMSVTHLNNYLKCPRLFYYRNLLRVPSAMNKHMSFGNAVHKALEDLHRAHKKSDLPNAEFLLKQFEKHLGRQVMSAEDYAHSLDFGRQTLQSYHNYYADKFNKNSEPEYNFSSHGVNLNGIPLTGKLDLIQITNQDQGHAHVVDYKTGSPDSKRKDLAKDGDYWRQIVFYQLLCDLSPKFPYKMVSGEINFIQPSNNGSFVRSHFEITPQDKEMLAAQITDVYEDIQNLRFLHPDEWSTCGECEFCLNFGSQH
jgi:DNA helicase-2/ATP-dependent DNA helicase PcrA